MWVHPSHNAMEWGYIHICIRGGGICGGASLRGVQPGGCRWMHPRKYAPSRSMHQKTDGQQEGGKHPTGMHSCSTVKLVLPCCYNFETYSFTMFLSFCNAFLLSHMRRNKETRTHSSRMRTVRWLTISWRGGGSGTWDQVQRSPRRNMGPGSQTGTVT